ncbi:DUF917 domain-containing protein [Kutzneria viridogrisea]|uniref:DUF917 domain-containing protein n=2 Tax=Kutzneria TaxID=43356 RepID=W5WUL6_9PSEU|nr:DUF917 domain-containing protein [Kutzneria albida]AHI01845.1 hypothetical protein KALB_8488 [Kutzneria albida DSM 43870]MBA8929736.1 hypothetical protein [Kutzneria viridogrisea]
MGDVGHTRVNEITVEDLPALVAGSSLLCSAAGDASFDGYCEIVAELLRNRGSVRLVELDSMPDDALCAAIGVMGGFAPMVELPPSGDEAVLAVRALEDRLGRKLDALVALNAAGPNAVFAVAAAAVLDLPLVNCDGMGRVLPLISQTTYALDGMPIGPLSAVSLAGDVLVLDSGLHRSDLLLRATMQAAGGWMLCAMYPATVSRLRTAAIPHATSRVLEVGRHLTSATERGALLDGLARAVGARVVGSGRIVELGHATRTIGPRHYPAVPTSVVVQEYADTGRMIRLEGQSELLVAVIDGVVAAAVPDVLCLIDRHDLRVVGVETVAVGDHVDVLVVPADARWHSKAGLTLAGPRAFGFPVRHPREEAQR